MGIDRPHDDADDADDADRKQQPDIPSGESPGREPRFETRSRGDYSDALRGALQSEDRDSWLPATKRPEWQEALTRGEVDKVGPGIVDERASTFSPEERRIADLLAGEGAAVVAVHDGYGKEGRKPDALVEGTPTEFKSLNPGASNTTVKGRLNDAKGQARDAVIDARDSGLSREEAEHGMERFLGSKYGHRIDAIRIVGDDYDIDWKRE
jgi:hypothetical protein